MPIALSLAEARRLAVASQGFGPRPVKPTVAHLRRIATQLSAFQIDSVNVVARAHYVPAFARLGPYPMAALDSLAYEKRELFEYWGHAACLLPISLYPLMRYRMHADETREYMRGERGAYLRSAYKEVSEHGPLTAAGLSNPGKRSGKWWGWGAGKMALEHLYNAGIVAIAGRRGFERMYDIAERVIPGTALDSPAPPREESMKQLICLGAKACGAGTLADIVGYLHVDGWHDRLPTAPRWEWKKGQSNRRSKPIAKRLVAELVEEGRLLPAQVEGWSEPAYVHPGASVPKTVNAQALVTPFDSLVWERKRVERLWGMQFTIEIYTPQPKRVYGYYVIPFLLGDMLVGRCDLKADRQRSVLMVHSAHIEPGQQPRDVAPALAAELREMQRWLGLDGIEVAKSGDLGAPLARALRARPRSAGQPSGGA